MFLASAETYLIPEIDPQPKPGDPRRRERKRRRLPGLNRAVEKIIPGCKSSQVVTKIVRSVRPQAEVAVEQEPIGIIVILASADSALHAEQAKAPVGKRYLGSRHVP